MTTLEIKADIFKRIDTLGRTKLFEIKGYLENLQQNEKELKDWLELSEDQKTRLKESIVKLDSDKSTVHQSVIKELRNKLNNV